MDRSKDAYHHGDLRNALVAAAVRLVEHGGHAGFSLREAAREVGVSANAAYRHFDDKAALLQAVATSGFERLSQRMQKTAARGSNGDDAGDAAMARFTGVGRAYVEFAIEHPELFRLMFGPIGIAGIRAVPAELSAPAKPTPYELLGQALDELVAEGVLPVARRPGAELKAWTVVHGFASLALDGALAFPTNRARTAALASALDFALVGLCGERRPTSRS